MATTIFSTTLSTNDTGYEDESARSKVPITGGAQDQIRVTFTGSTAGATWVDNAAIGIWNGDVTTQRFNCTATPTELLFSTNGLANGGHGFQLGASGSIISDWVNFAGFTTSNLLIVIVDFNTLNGRARVATASTGAFHMALAATNSYNVASFASSGVGNIDWVNLVSLIEVQTTAAAASNIMGLQSRIQLGH
jgi:hypothetical protein